jgi:hypothetical protein
MMLLARALLVVLLALWLPLAVAAQGRRVVDVVRAGNAASEREHDYDGAGTTVEAIDGRTFRQARGWLSYSLAVFEDTEVTLECAFRGSEGQRLAFDLLVEGRKIVTHTFVSPSPAPVKVAFRIPFDVTKGLTSIHVMLKAAGGLTPGLLELRTVQEHLERPAGGAPEPARAAFW